MTKEIKRSELEGLARIHCTENELCAFFKCSRDTLYDRIREYYDMTVGEFLREYSSEGKISLRRKTWSLALGGHWDALKFLNKNHLDLVDETTVNNRNTDVPLTESELKAELEARGLPTDVLDE